MGEESRDNCIKSFWCTIAGVGIKNLGGGEVGEHIEKQADARKNSESFR